MKIFALILAFAAIALVDIPALFKAKQRRTLIAYFSLLFTGFILSLLQVVGVKMPNPHKGIEYLIKLISP